MAKPIRNDEPDTPTDTAPPLTQAMRLAAGLGVLPLIGLGLLMRATRSSPTPQPQGIHTEPSQDKADLPSRQEVESALRRLTDATLPKAPPAAKPTAGRKTRSR